MAEPPLFRKVAVVTGGASGIGRETAQRLARAGAAVVVADLNVDGALDVAEKLRLDGATASAVAVDVTDAAATDRMAEHALHEHGRIDVLSCNAGLASYPRTALETSEADFDRVFAVNVKGVWLCARSVIPAMRAAGGGSIVVTGSVMGERTRPGFSAYAPSKAAANHLSRTLAVELAPDGIRVNAVAPVATDTGMLPMFLGQDHPEKARKAFIAGIPMGRLAQPADVADATVFLASDAARFVTGVVLPVDGGRSI